MTMFIGHIPAQKIRVSETRTLSLLRATRVPQTRLSALSNKRPRWPCLKSRGRKLQNHLRHAVCSQAAVAVSSVSTPPVLVAQQQAADSYRLRRFGVTLIGCLACVVSVNAAILLWPGAAHASSGTLSASMLDAFKQWLQYVDSLGNWGPVLFVGTVVVAEMVPLLPTQPIALASGLLFGPVKGTFLMLLGVTLAAVNAFLISRGIGNKLAKQVIAAEVGEQGHGQSGGIMQSKLADLQKAVASGSFMQQFMAVVLLRLTPVVPYSASNYLLGLTPLQFPPFVLGTALGMTVWSLLYASLGGASRTLLTSGVSFNVIFADLAEKAGGYTQNIALAALGVVGVIAGFWAINTFFLKDKTPKPDESQSKTEGEGEGTDATTVELVRESVSTRQ